MRLANLNIWIASLLETDFSFYRFAVYLYIRVCLNSEDIFFKIWLGMHHLKYMPLVFGEDSHLTKCPFREIGYRI